jgi:enamine deaminase RidA (YjgF/YER057c/UK114 family)
VVKQGSTLYLSGVVADDLSAPMAGQTKQVLDKIAKLLEGAGSDVSKILSATVYLADFGAKDAMNDVWQAWFAPD